MAGTVSLQNTAGWVTYLNTKATKAKENLPITQEIEAYAVNATTIVLPFLWSPSTTLTLPAFESDTTTASIKTFRFLNAYRLPVKITYTGNATA